jgi:hypothetical protein
MPYHSQYKNDFVLQKSRIYGNNERVHNVQNIDWNTRRIDK